MPYDATVYAAAISHSVASGSTYTAQTCSVAVAAPIEVQSVAYTFTTSDTWTLSIDGVDVGSATGTGAQTITLGSPLALSPGHHEFKVRGTVARTFNYQGGENLPTGTGSPYIAWSFWQETTNATVPMTVNFKIQTGTKYVQVAVGNESGSTYAAETWTVTFAEDVELLGYIGHLGVPRLSYQFRVNGTLIDSGYGGWTPATPLALSAGTHTFKLTPPSSVTWNYNASNTRTGSGTSSVTGWTLWQENGTVYPAGSMVFQIPAAAGSVTLAGTLQAKTAAFTAETVISGSLAATLREKTAAFTLGTVAAVGLSGTLQAKTAAFTIATPAADVTMSSTLTRKVGAFTVLSDATATLEGTLPAKTAAFSLSASAQVSLAATMQPKTAQVILATTDRTALLGGTLRRKTSAFAVSSLPFVLLDATLQPKIATFVARAVTPVTPAPDRVDAAMSVVVARAFGPVTMNGTQPVYDVSKAEIARARQQIVVDGVDITYFRGVTTPDVTYTLLEPLLYGPGRLELPQVVAWAEEFSAGDLSWLRAQAPVEVHLVIDDVVVVENVYKGFIAAFDHNGTDLSVELGGEANGRAAMRDRQNPIFPRINDIGHQIADAVRDLGLPHYPPLGAVTGIETMTTGGTGHLDHINNLHAKAWTRSGKQWSCMPDVDTGVYETHRKDGETIHGTVFIDDAKTVANLRRDISEEPNQIFVTCVTPAGMRVRFGKYPGLVQGPVPDFPGNMTIGSTGEGVRLLVGKLHASGYLKLAEVEGGYDEDVDAAVRQLQEDAGLPETGDVNLATWRALYDLDVTGLSLEWANIQPAAQRSKTRKFDRSANGTIMGFNDDYDPEVIVRHRTIDLGTGVTRSQAREFARTVLHDSDAPNWIGDITFHTGALIRGEGAEGMTVTPDDVMDARELRPGMNLWLPQFDGGTLVHVAACEPNSDGVVTVTVDTRFRDAMEVWEVIARNKESRNDPSRQRERRYRASTIVKDSIGEWDEFGGMLGVDLPLERGWNVFPVVAAMEGQIRELKIQLATPAEFAVAVFGQKVDVGWLNNLIEHPLTISGTKKWETEFEALDENLYLISMGTHSEPCGYWPGRKKWQSVTGEEANPDYDPTADSNDTGSDDTETIEVTTSESSGTLTGKHVDAAGFPYFASDRKVIWVAVWVRSANKIEAQRIMKPQLEAGA